MRRPLAVLTGLTLLTLVSGCGTATKAPPSQGANRNVINAYIPANRTTTPRGENTSVPNTTSSATPPANSSTTAPLIPGPTSAGMPETLPLATQNPGPLVAASFVTDKIGFVASAQGIYRTTDGGVTWAEVYQSPDPITGLVATRQTATGQTGTFAWAWTKDYMLASFGVTASLFIRAEFAGQHTPKMGNAPIEDAAFASSNTVVFVSDGVVWASDNVGSGWLQRTPTRSVSSVAAISANTWYAATTTGNVYETTDGGLHWSLVLSTSLQQGLGWRAQLMAVGGHVAVLFTSSDVTALHQPYVLYDSNDGGQTWNALLDDPEFQDYGSVKPLYAQTTPAPQAGPFTLLANGNVAVIGRQVVGNSVVTLSVITPSGQRIISSPIGPSASSTAGFGQGGIPTAISAPDSSHFFVVGNNGEQAVIEVSGDGGATWTAR